MRKYLFRNLFRKISPGSLGLLLGHPLQLALEGPDTGLLLLAWPLEGKEGGQLGSELLAEGPLGSEPQVGAAEPPLILKHIVSV